MNNFSIPPAFVLASYLEWSVQMFLRKKGSAAHSISTHSVAGTLHNLILCIHIAYQAGQGEPYQMLQKFVFKLKPFGSFLPLMAAPKRPGHGAKMVYELLCQ